MSDGRTADEMLDWLCWVLATEGERFYPPDETAEECIDTQGLEDDFQKGAEYGQHVRAFSTAQERFRDLERHGFNPRERAEREIERAREDGLELEDIDWGWYDD